MNYRSVIVALAAASTLTACSTVIQRPIDAPAATPQGNAVAVDAKRPVASPISLNFYSRHPLRFTVKQVGYNGHFNISDASCVDIVRVNPTAAKGPNAAFKVTPTESPSALLARENSHRHSTLP